MSHTYSQPHYQSVCYHRYCYDSDNIPILVNPIIGSILVKMSLKHVGESWMQSKVVNPAIDYPGYSLVNPSSFVKDKSQQ